MCAGLLKEELRNEETGPLSGRPLISERAPGDVSCSRWCIVTVILLCNRIEIERGNGPFRAASSLSVQFYGFCFCSSNTDKGPGKGFCKAGRSLRSPLFKTGQTTNLLCLVEGESMSAF